MTDITVKEKVEGLRIMLLAIQEGVKDIQKHGVELEFKIASEYKTVDVKSKGIFEISVKATINQEL
jgi:hypothetical protein